jgi:hypothetical protein
VHPTIAAIIERTLVAEPDQRFATAAELQQAIEHAVFEAKLGTSTLAIASFLQENVGDRAGKRKEAISLGIKAAADREKYAAMMLSNVSVQGMDTDAARNVASIAPPEIPTSVSRQTSGTLGSAAIDLSPFQSNNKRNMAVAGAALGAALGLGGLLWVVRSPSRAAVSVPASASAPPSLASGVVPDALPKAFPPTLPPPTPIAPPSPAAESPATRMEVSVPTTVPVSSLPVVATVTPVTMHPPIQHPQAPSKPVRSSSKPKIDDGF